NIKLKSVRGIVTRLCSNHGWINKSIFFDIDVVSDNMPVHIAERVIALVEENETTHVLKAIKVWLRFMPYKGDLLLNDYSLKLGNSKMSIHTVSPLKLQRISEVCVTSIDGRTGVIDDIIFFTLDSLQKPNDYTPGLYDIVNVVAVDSIQPHCSWRAVSMVPVELCIDQAL
ncbi:Cancer/testis antigen 55, partial [Lemmus lemmus]